MKKLMMAGIAAFAAVTAFAEVKIGIVDMAILVRNHASYDTNRQLLASTEKEYKDRLEAMRLEAEELQAKGRKLMDEYRNPMLATAAKAKIESDVQNLQGKLLDKQQQIRNEAMRSQQELSDTEARLLRIQVADLKKRISNFAKKNDYAIVLDAATAMYNEESVDITDALLKDMGVDPKEARAKEKADEGK